ncbi:MAG: PEGA domain-containing protein [Methanomicrobiales archaeon]|nr:PEGA domain-containing protein [Methanomicrobiales archaeon]
MQWHIVLMSLLLLFAGLSCTTVADEKQYSAPGIGFIEIRSDIDGARVYFDTLYMGYVWGGNLTIPIDTSVPASWKNVRMEYSNYTPYAGPFVQTKAGMTTAYKIDLGKDTYYNTGIVTFSSEPAGAEFILNNESMGITPDSGTLIYYTVPRGLYTVTTRRPGNTTITDQLYVDNSAITNYLVNLTKSPYGGLQVNSTPEGAMVFVDNIIRGITPVELSDLFIGDHVVDVRKDGFLDYVKNISVIGGYVESMDAVLVTNPQAGVCPSDNMEQKKP